MTVLSLLRRWWPAIAGLAVLAAVLALPLAGDRPSATSARAAGAPAAVQAVASATPTPGIEAVTGARPPAAGQARLVVGPFTDRLRLLRLAVSKGVVRGTFAQVADNSAVLVMEVQADFYDSSGLLLGSRRAVLRQPDVVAAGQGGTGAQRYGGNVVFAVPAPQAFASRVASALVSVPTLVNE